MVVPHVKEGHTEDIPYGVGSHINRADIQDQQDEASYQQNQWKALAYIAAVGEQEQEQQKLEDELAQQRADAAAAEAQAPTPAISGLVGVGYWENAVAQYSWPVSQALRVMACESGGNPNVVSHTNDYGLFQLHDRPDAINPYTNIAVAYSMWADRGWQPWRSSASCHGLY